MQRKLIFSNYIWVPASFELWVPSNICYSTATQEEASEQQQQKKKVAAAANSNTLFSVCQALSSVFSTQNSLVFTTVL
jgi:hypothetical protein